MTIYDIDIKLQELIDKETGEILDFEQFEELQMARDKKIENMALWIKDLNAEAKAIKEEEKALAERRKSAENKSERLKDYIARMLNGEIFKSPRASISYRKTTAVEIEEGFTEWAKKNNDSLLIYKEPEPSKTAIKEYIQSGGELQYAKLIERNSIQIK